MVVIGGEAAKDLGDMWAFNMVTHKWIKVEIEVKPIRFHTTTVIGSKLYVFGGCYGDYEYMNSFTSYDFTEVRVEAKDQRTQVLTGVKVEEIIPKKDVPSPRWGHSASEYDG